MVCPHCAEEIQDAARVCRYCGRRTTPRNWERPIATIVLAALVVAAAVLVFRKVTHGSGASFASASGQSECSLYQHDHAVIAVMYASDAATACQRTATTWTAKGLGTFGGFWVSETGDRTLETDPSTNQTYGNELQSSCTATYTNGATISVYDTSGGILGGDVCTALASTSGWTVS